LKTSEAAALLNVSPNTLRAWERRFGYPKPQRSPGKHRLYTHGEITALKDALKDGLSISSAVSRAREGLIADADSLLGALSAFDAERADSAMEGALALRSLDRSVEDVLLPSVEELFRRHGRESARWAFAASWASDWLNRAQRLAAPTAQRGAILVGDASSGELDPDQSAIRAFELFINRAGSKVLRLSIEATADLGDALDLLHPDAVVVAGRHARDDAVARWAYAVRAATGPLPMSLFRRDVIRRLRSRSTGARHLAEAPSQAERDLREFIEAEELHARDSGSPTPLVPRANRAS
jgi:hypothetical protein